MGTKGMRPGMQKTAELAKSKRSIDTESHHKLCLIAGNWLRKPGRIDPAPCPNVMVEVVSLTKEQCDVFGWNYWTTVMIEVKVSRSDFLADAKKAFRNIPEDGVGEFRYYCCPNGMISSDEIPEKWGLLYEKNCNIAVIKNALRQKSNERSERNMLSSIIRREIRPQLFCYRKTKENE